MLLTAESTKDRKVSIHDVAGHKIPGVIEFDTDTCEAKLIVWLVQEEGMTSRPILVSRGPAGNVLHIVSTKIPGAYAILDGQKV